MLEKTGPALAKRHNQPKEFGNLDRWFIQYTNIVKTFNEHHKKFDVTCFAELEQAGSSNCNL